MKIQLGDRINYMQLLVGELDHLLVEMAHWFFVPAINKNNKFERVK
jgi:hypothetical protein